MLFEAILSTVLNSRFSQICSQAKTSWIGWLSCHLMQKLQPEHEGVCGQDGSSGRQPLPAGTRGRACTHSSHIQRESKLNPEKMESEFWDTLIDSRSKAVTCSFGSSQDASVWDSCSSDYEWQLFCCFMLCILFSVYALKQNICYFNSESQ